MKEKIVGLFVCMLMIATAVPAVTSIKTNAIHAAVPSNLKANRLIVILKPSDARTSGSICVFTTDGLTFSITGGLGVHLKIKNNGAVNATNVPWKLQVWDGSIGRINKTLNGTIDIPAGGTKTICTGMLFGVCPLRISAGVDQCCYCLIGFQFIVYSMIRK
jgi:hypothetical protein